MEEHQEASSTEIQLKLGLLFAIILVKTPLLPFLKSSCSKGESEQYRKVKLLLALKSNSITSVLEQDKKVSCGLLLKSKAVSGVSTAAILSRSSLFEKSIAETLVKENVMDLKLRLLLKSMELIGLYMQFNDRSSVFFERSMSEIKFPLLQSLGLRMPKIDKTLELPIMDRLLG